MKKKILAALAAVSVVTALVPVTSAFAAEEVTVRVHYDRADTTGWAVFVYWAGGTEGNVWYSFDDNGVAEFVTPDIATTMFIVAEEGWGGEREDSQEKPYNGTMGGDRSIDTTRVVDGEVDVYVAVGSLTNTYADPITDPDNSSEAPVESTDDPVESTDDSGESTDDPTDDPAESNELTLKFTWDAEDADSYAIKYWGFGFEADKHAAFENGEATAVWNADEIEEGADLGFGLETADGEWVGMIEMTPALSEFDFGDTVAVVLSASVDENGVTTYTAAATLVEGGESNNESSESTDEPGNSTDESGNSTDESGNSTDAPANSDDNSGKGDGNNSTANNSNTSVADSDTNSKGNNSETGIALAVAPVVLAAGAVAAVVVVNKKRN